MKRVAECRIFFGGDDDGVLWTWECWKHGNKYVTGHFGDELTWREAGMALRQHWDEFHQDEL